MKCSGCGADSNRKSRVAASGKCPRCGVTFVLDPKDGAPLTDVAFRDAIHAVSAGDKLRWGVEHLYYEVCRRIARRGRRTRIGMVFGLLVLGAFLGTCAGGFSDTPILIPVVAIAVALVGAPFVLRKPATAPLAQETFDMYWRKWCAARGTPKGVIIRRDPPAQAYQSAEPDIGDYSFDRAVICDRARTVNLLLANNFHFEHSSAVLAVNGYPRHAFERVKAMLKKNPRLSVFVLHDASAEGCDLPRRLREDPEWFGGPAGANVHVADVGIRPRDARKFRGLYRPASAPDPRQLRSSTPPERAFLEEFVVNLAVLRPEAILKATFRAMLPPRANDTESAEVGYWDSFG